MRELDKILNDNREWATGVKENDPKFFARLTEVQDPDFLWIGCADSRVSAQLITGFEPGETFVHRNVANLVHTDDINCTSVIQFAVAVLKVKHIIVCGHYGCGGIKAVLDNATEGLLDQWLTPVKLLKAAHNEELEALDADAQWKRLCDINVESQVHTVSTLPVIHEAWNAGEELHIHGFIYDMYTGLIKDLNVSIDSGA